MDHNIVLLDGGGVGYDIIWPDFSALGRYTRHDLTRPEEVIKRIARADIVLTNKVTLTREHIEASPALKYIGSIATGYNHIDVKAAAGRGITVTNVPNYSTDAVVQLVFSFMLEFTNHVVEHAKAVAEGEWINSKYFCFWKHPVIELAGKTMGVVGFGHIGRKVAEVANAFGMRVLAHTPRPKNAPPYPNFAFVGLQELFAQADFISLHCPLTPENTGMVNAALLGGMKKSAFLINTARGPLINEKDLAAAIKNNRLAGAGLDVVGVEPMLPSNPLLDLPGVLITPHYGWASVEARTRLMQEVFSNLQNYLEGRPVNIARSD